MKATTFFGDIYIEKGVIKELGTELNKECETLDGKGLVLMPAFIDTHAHFRDPGFEYKEDIESGSKVSSERWIHNSNLNAKHKTSL